MKSFFKSLFALAILSFSAGQMFAQCVSNEAASGGTTNQNYYGQSFVATGCDAMLSSYEFYRTGNTAVPGTVEVFAGQTTGGTPLYSSAVTIPAVASGFDWVSMDLSAGNITMTEGNMYTVRFLPASGNIAYQNIFGGYPAGAMLYSTTGFGPTGSYDTAFRVNSAPAPAAGTGCVSNEAASGGTTNQNYYGQSFVATGCEAMLSSYEFYRTGNTDVPGTVEVFAGQTTGGTPLYSSAVTIPAVASGFEWVSMDLSAGNVALTEGSMYTVRFLPASGNIAYQNIFGGYPAGAMLYSTTGFGPTGSYDTAFRVNSAEMAEEPVPTMGEWALITFGLIIMSMGVITVRRREQNLIVKAA